MPAKVSPPRPWALDVAVAIKIGFPGVPPPAPVGIAPADLWPPPPPPPSPRLLPAPPPYAASKVPSEVSPPVAPSLLAALAAPPAPIVTVSVAPKDESDKVLRLYPPPPPPPTSDAAPRPPEPPAPHPSISAHVPTPGFVNVPDALNVTCIGEIRTE